MNLKFSVLGLSNLFVIVLCFLIQPLSEDYRLLVSNFRWFVAPALVAILTIISAFTLKKMKDDGWNAKTGKVKILKANFLIGIVYFLLAIILYIVAISWKM